MPTTAPTVIQGPAFVIFGSYTFSTQGDVEISYEVDTWNPRSSTAGNLGARMRGVNARISFTPVGMYTSATAVKYMPFNPANIGASILSGTAAVIPISGNKITFAKAGISKMPSLTLSALSTLWGQMEILAIGDPAITPTNAAAFQTIAAATTDTTFDETKIISPRYTATFTGADGVEYAGVEPDDAGFVIDVTQEVGVMRAANFGPVAAILQSMGLTVTFKPLSMAESEIALAMGLQNSGVVRPGDTIGLATDLVIAGTGLSFTAKKMGISGAGLMYGAGVWRQGALKFENKIYATTGVAQPLWVFA